MFNSKRVFPFANLIFTLFVPILIGTAIFFWLCGPRCLDPTNIAWTGEGDGAQHYIGWLFYRYSDWTFPIGLSPDWGMENAVSVIYADALPFFAIPFKLVRKWLSEPFQYYGIWLLLCFILSSFFTIRLLNEYHAPKLVQICTAILAATSPILIWRIPNHQSLAGHWLIIWALGLVLSYRSSFKWVEWGILFCSSIAIHPYFTIMLIPLFVADGISRELIPLVKNFDRSRFFYDFVNCIILICAIIFVAWQVGLIGLPDLDPSAGGFGVYKSNINTLVNPQGFSIFLRDLPAHPGEYEGFGYLGAGVICLIIITLTLKCTFTENKPIFKTSLIPLSLALFLLTSVAISSHIGINSSSFNIYNGQRLDFLNIVRASGRLIWVLWYFILFASIITLTSAWKTNIISTRSSSILVLLVVIIQIIDINKPNIDTRRHLLMREKSDQFFSVDPKWKDIASVYSNLRLLHNPGNAYENWRDIAYIAGIYHMKTNTGYWARTKINSFKDAIKEDNHLLETKNFQNNTAYVITNRDISSIAMNPPENATLACLNGLHLILPNWQGPQLPSCWPKITEVIFKPKLNKIYSTKSGDIDGIKLLSNGWSSSEPWGTWSNGKIARIILIAPEENTTLVLTVQPFITANHNQQQLIIKDTNGTIITERTITETSEIKIPLNKQIVKINNSQSIVDLFLELPDAASPSSLGVNTDTRMLGVGLITWKVISHPKGGNKLLQ